MIIKELKMNIVKSVLLGIGFIIISNCTHSIKENEDYTSYVNCFVGTDGPGNTYPGAVVPFGMIQLSPDNGLSGWDRISGYFWPDSTLAGFSHKHLTGTGAGDLYDILVFPYNSKFTDDLWPNQDDYRPYSMFSHDQEKASPGYYSVDLLSSGIKAELTATERVGMHQYTFTEDESSRILIDLGYSLNWDSPTETYLKLQDEKTIVGYRYSKGWAKDQREHFVIKLSEGIHDIRFYEDNKPVDAMEAKAQNTKLIISFKSKQNHKIKLKVALSSHSIEGAQNNLNQELPGWNFDAIVAQAREKWNQQLACIHVEASKAKKELFYTNLYHCFLTPSLHSDVDGWYKGADGEYHQANDYNKYETFSLWDTYRTAHPFYTLVVPDKVSDFVKSFLSHYQETGLLPVWSLAGNETNMMIGYHSVPVIVDAYFKGIAMDADLAYEACKATAMSDAWDLKSYKKLGYVPTGKAGHGNWSVSKTLEYAYDDWCIAQFAKALNKVADYTYFTDRSRNWKHHYDANTQFLRPKDSLGNFTNGFIAKEYTSDFCESNAWHYLFHLPHDITSLIDTMGRDMFIAKLDSMFTFYSDSTDELPIFSTGMIGQYAHGNEPSHHVAYLYNQIGKPEKTNELVHQILDSQYSLSPDGYCGNEDCGQMSAWFVMAAMGIYPVNPADGIYHLSKPWVEKAVINLPNNKQFIITSTINTGSESIKVNGEISKKLTLNHATLLKGGTIEFCE
jgi:predicted alpha-1,2-mannosidase